MKNVIKYMVVLIVALTIGIEESKARNPFDEIAEMENVQYIYIGKSMLSSVGNVGGIDLNGVTSDLKSLEIVTTEDAAAMKDIVKLMSEVTSKMEKMQDIRNNEDGERVRIYVMDGGNTFSEMLMQVEEPQEYVLIRLVGKVDPENIKNLMKSGSIK